MGIEHRVEMLTTQLERDNAELQKREARKLTDGRTAGLRKAVDQMTAELDSLTHVLDPNPIKTQMLADIESKRMLIAAAAELIDEGKIQPEEVALVGLIPPGGHDE